MQMNVLQRIDELIEESREIGIQAEKIQAGGPLHSAKSYAVAQFQKQAEGWYASVLEILPADLRERFEREWAGPEGDCGPQHFVSDPVGSDPHGRQVYGDRYLRTIDSTKVLFAFPFDRCFQEPLRRQRLILGEAKYHPDLVRQRRRDDLVRTHLTFHDLHPRIIDAAGPLFADGHYRPAIFQSCIALASAVREKSGSDIKDDTPMMRTVFSSKEPLLKLSNHPGEQEGFMSLFAGATLALRNPRGHQLGEEEDQDATETFQWLAFISALMRVVDRAERVEREENEQVPSHSQDIL